MLAPVEHRGLEVDLYFQVYNFADLERVTQYEGFTAESRVIRQFWSVVHRLPEEQKRQLLQFTTGTDRVPLEGMSKLRFVIVRQGPDSDRFVSSGGGRWSYFGTQVVGTELR